jgi:hypothetical protein
VLNLHHDSFAPFTTRPDVSCGYVLLKLCCATAGIHPMLWIFIDGPEHLTLRYKASWSRKKEIFGQDSDQLCVIARLNSDLETKLKGSSVGELV